MEIFDIRLIGVNAESAHKLLLTLGFIAGILLLRAVIVIVPDHGIRDIKDAVARAILKEFDAASIELASATYEIVGLPTVRVERTISQD